MSLTRRSLIKGTGAAGAAVAAGAMAPKVFKSPVAAQDTIKLSVWKAPHSTDDQKFFDDKLAAYAADNPGVEVEYRVTPWETWQETYTSAFAGSDPPDISYMVNSFFPKFADAGSLVPLSAIEGANIAEDWQSLYDPAIWGLGERNGEAYGLPFLQSGISLVWNKALFTEAGLDPETPPKTWDELVDFAKKLTKDDGSQWGYSIMDNTTGEMLNFVPVPIVNYGGPLATDDDTEWLAHGPEYEKGLQLQIDMIKTD
jgi:multiple sugar transport system substrate-binding protein